MDKRKQMAELRNALKMYVRNGNKTMTDDDALSVSSLHEKWAAGRVYTDDEVNSVILHNDKIYRVIIAHTAQEHQPPDAEGMLAVYRPINPTHAGTIDDPIPWEYGMDCFADLYYTYANKLWLCGGDMVPCVWEPGSAGVWQWSEMVE